MPKKPTSWTELIRKWPSIKDLAIDINEKEATVRKWMFRENIPSRYWDRLLDAARKRKIPLSADDLVGLVAGL